MGVDVGVEVGVGADGIEGFFLFVHIDDVGPGLREEFGAEQAEQVALANAPLADQDHDEVLAENVVYLVEVGLAENGFHVFRV